MIGNQLWTAIQTQAICATTCRRKAANFGRSQTVQVALSVATMGETVSFTSVSTDHTCTGIPHHDITAHQATSPGETGD